MGLMGLRSWFDRRNPYNPVPREYSAFGLDEYLSLVAHTFNGNTYYGLRTTMDTSKEEPITNEFVSLVQQAYKRNGVIFGATAARMYVFSQVEFKYQSLADKRLFGTPALAPLERPEANVTGVELLRRAEQDVSLAGNWYGTNRYGGIRRLRPDWVTIMLGSDLEPDDPALAEDCRIIGYIFQPPGNRREPSFFTVDEIAHWSPNPDPEAQFRGMAWPSPVVREIMADNAGTDLRLKFYENGGTPNLVVKAPPDVTSIEKYREWRQAMEDSSAGVRNAFRNLYLAAGADATSVGLNLRELDFKALQGGGETRMAVASRVPAVILGISEGLGGSSLNAGNYGMARRQLADGFLHSEWQDFCGCVEKFVPPPTGSRLWFDKSSVPMLHEDAKDAAAIEQVKAATIRQYIDAGFTPESAVAATNAGDVTLLEHSGLVSVQLQVPGQQPTPDPTIPDGEAA